MALTAQQIFKIGAALIAERPNDDPDMVEFSPSYLNIILQECLNAENSVREAEGRELLRCAPFIESLEAEIDYSNHLTRVAIPYALAANFYRESGDNYHEQQFRAEYVSAVNEAMVFSFKPIEDVYR